LPEF